VQKIIVKRYYGYSIKVNIITLSSVFGQKLWYDTGLELLNLATYQARGKG
jgi:hypothetical protein